MVQLYSYCGFPRSLNAINTFMEERIADQLIKARSLQVLEEEIRVSFYNFQIITNIA
ncbi:hypothetical protein LOK61_13115 [Pedobacter mucosus]|nr:hypothetical protein LOK61_13115 [Pedobacter mucosus]